MRPHVLLPPRCVLLFGFWLWFSVGFPLKQSNEKRKTHGSMGDWVPCPRPKEEAEIDLQGLWAENMFCLATCINTCAMDIYTCVCMYIYIYIIMCILSCISIYRSIDLSTWYMVYSVCIYIYIYLFIYLSPIEIHTISHFIFAACRCFVLLAQRFTR